jgi:hypothetical protein
MKAYDENMWRDSVTSYPSTSSNFKHRKLQKYNFIKVPTSIFYEIYFFKQITYYVPGDVSFFVVRRGVHMLFMYVYVYAKINGKL